MRTSVLAREAAGRRRHHNALPAAPQNDALRPGRTFVSSAASQARRQDAEAWQGKRGKRFLIRRRPCCLCELGNCVLQLLSQAVVASTAPFLNPIRARVLRINAFTPSYQTTCCFWPGLYVAKPFLADCPGWSIDGCARVFTERFVSELLLERGLFDKGCRQERV